MKIYTKKGDSGETCLFGGKRIPKYHLRLEATGSVDELNAALGVAIAWVELAEIINQCTEIQKDLFAIGAHLATDYTKNSVPHSLPALRDNAVTWLEQHIDIFDTQLEPLQHFILPSGSKAGSLFHIARTACRQAERRVVELTEAENIYIQPIFLQYLNRLSDYLFTVARIVNKHYSTPEIPWVHN